MVGALTRALFIALLCLGARDTHGARHGKTTQSAILSRNATTESVSVNDDKYFLRSNRDKQLKTDVPSENGKLQKSKIFVNAKKLFSEIHRPNKQRRNVSAVLGSRKDIWSFLRSQRGKHLKINTPSKHGKPRNPYWSNKNIRNFLHSKRGKHVKINTPGKHRKTVKAKIFRPNNRTAELTADQGKPFYKRMMALSKDLGLVGNATYGLAFHLGQHTKEECGDRWEEGCRLAVACFNTFQDDGCCQEWDGQMDLTGACAPCEEALDYCGPCYQDSPCGQHEEANELKEIFHMIDADSSGAFDMGELKQFLESIGEEHDDKELAAMMKKADNNGNGHIDFEEFEKWAIEKHAEHEEYEEYEEHEDEMKDFFDMIDVDQSGAIDKKELKQFMESYGEPVPDEEVEMTIRHADHDKNGKIDFDEFKRAHAEHEEQEVHDVSEDDLKGIFRMIDADGSGDINKGELKNFMESMGEEVDENEIEMNIAQADENGNGKIDFPEFKKAHEEHEELVEHEADGDWEEVEEELHHDDEEFEEELYGEWDEGHQEEHVGDWQEESKEVKEEGMDPAAVSNVCGEKWENGCSDAWVCYQIVDEHGCCDGGHDPPQFYLENECAACATVKGICDDCFPESPCGGPPPNPPTALPPVEAAPEDAGAAAASEDAGAPAEAPAAVSADKCLIADPNWHCVGSQCIPAADYELYSAYGGPWCLTADHELCKEADKDWCGGECHCPGNCQHACGRCPASTSPALSPLSMLSARSAVAVALHSTSQRMLNHILYHEPSETNYGDPACPCIGIDNVEGKRMVRLDESTTAAYPVDLGASCQAWDDGRSFLGCMEGQDPGKGKGWCVQQWCYVDPCKCAISTLPKTSTYLPGATYQSKPIYYSYATCGGKDTYTVDRKESCVNQVTQGECEMFDKCAWHEGSCMGKELVGTCNKRLHGFTWGRSNCRCIGIDNLLGDLVVNVGGKSKSKFPSKVTKYPADVGATCQAWDNTRHPDCQNKVKTLRPDWCAQTWCYVDPCSCDLSIPPKTSYYVPGAVFQGRPVYYSYHTCGSEDTWTAEHHESACVNQKSEEDCDKHSKCAWTKNKECVGKELAGMCPGMAEKEEKKAKSKAYASAVSFMLLITVFGQ